jgi:hypothetical protein
LALEEMRGENSEQNVLRGAMPMKQHRSDEDQGAVEYLLQEYQNVPMRNQMTVSYKLTFH